MVLTLHHVPGHVDDGESQEVETEQGISIPIYEMGVRIAYPAYQHQILGSASQPMVKLFTTPIPMLPRPWWQEVGTKRPW